VPFRPRLRPGGASPRVPPAAVPSTVCCGFARLKRRQRGTTPWFPLQSPPGRLRRVRAVFAGAGAHKHGADRCASRDPPLRLPKSRKLPRRRCAKRQRSRSVCQRSGTGLEKPSPNPARIQTLTHLHPRPAARLFPARINARKKRFMEGTLRQPSRLQVCRRQTKTQPSRTLPEARCGAKKHLPIRAKDARIGASLRFLFMV
jgi:hypothetical protein